VSDQGPLPPPDEPSTHPDPPPRSFQAGPSVGPPNPPSGGGGIRDFANGRWGFLVIGLIFGGLIGGAAGVASGGKTTNAASLATASTPSIVPPSPSPSPSPVVETPPLGVEPSPFVPDPSDFDLTIKTLSKQCFGTAGCNITYRIQVGYSGLPLDSFSTYEVTYQVSGDESGAIINTLTVTGDQSSVQQEEFASTTSSAVNLKVKVISVDQL
jgi:hypothetical protein